MAADEDEPKSEDLRRRLEEAEETLRAIRTGEVDALVVDGADGERVFTLQGADHPYRALIESMQQGAASLGADGTILYCNRRFAEMVETAAGEGHRGGRRRLPAGRAAARPSRPCCAGPDAASSQGELQFRAADGTLLPVYLALAPCRWPTPTALCLVVTDLTEQKKHQDLQEANRRKDEFLAMLAHELRNPLAPIRNALYLHEARRRSTSSSAERGPRR